MESSTVSDSVFYDATPSLEVEDYEHLKSLLEEYNAILAYPGLEMTLVSAHKLFYLWNNWREKLHVAKVVC
jgi:hypothetical protein